MGRIFAVKSNVFVLFSTLFVYSAVHAQSADDLYLQAKKNPNLTKDQLDQAKVEALDRARVQKLNDENQEEKKKDEAIDKKLASEPPLPDGPDGPEDDKEESKTGATESKPKSGTSAATSVGGSSSSDSPKVAYDPMPDEIHFEGDTPTPSPTPAKSGPRPPKRKIR